MIGSGLAGSQAMAPGDSSLVAPRTFNPLVPYVTATWYPYRIGGVLTYGYANAFRLIPSPRAERAGLLWTSIWVYAADQCVLASSRLSCGSAANRTSGVMTVSGRAPDVGRHAAYWISHANGDMDIPAGVTMVAFRYAPLGWAVVESTGKPADVIRIAANLRYGQTSHLRLPVRLTDLPPSWRDLRQVEFLDNKPQMSWWAILGRGETPAGVLPDSVSLNVSVGKGQFPACNPHNAYYACRVTTIDGEQVFLSTLPAVGGQPVDYRLTALNADGFSVEIDVTGPHPPLSPAEVFARHLQLLGPNQAHWTTHPVG